MKPAVKLAVFGVVLAGALGGGAVVGAAIGPIGDPAVPSSGHDGHSAGTVQPWTSAPGD